MGIRYVRESQIVRDILEPDDDENALGAPQFIERICAPNFFDAQALNYDLATKIQGICNSTTPLQTLESYSNYLPEDKQLQQSKAVRLVFQLSTICLSPHFARQCTPHSVLSAIGRRKWKSIGLEFDGMQAKTRYKLEQVSCMGLALLRWPMLQLVKFPPLFGNKIFVKHLYSGMESGEILFEGLFVSAFDWTYLFSPQTTDDGDVGAQNDLPDPFVPHQDEAYYEDLVNSVSCRRQGICRFEQSGLRKCSTRNLSPIHDAPNPINPYSTSATNLKCLVLECNGTYTVCRLFLRSAVNNEEEVMRKLEKNEIPRYNLDKTSVSLLRNPARQGIRWSETIQTLELAQTYGARKAQGGSFTWIRITKDHHQQRVGAMLGLIHRSGKSVTDYFESAQWAADLVVGDLDQQQQEALVSVVISEHAAFNRHLVCYNCLGYCCKDYVKCRYRTSAAEKRQFAEAIAHLSMKQQQPQLEDN